MTIFPAAEIGAQGVSGGSPSAYVDATNAKFDQNVANDLVAAGWSEDAARAVVSLNREWFALQREENPVGFAQQLALLTGLGKKPGLMRFLTAHPETAGLLATLDDPEPIVESLSGPEEDYELIAGCYVQQPVPSDVQALALGLKENRELVCTLKRRGLIGAEVLFVFERDDDPAREYELWLRESMQSKLYPARP